MSANTPWPWEYKPNSGQIIAPMVVYLADDGACGDDECCGHPTYWVEIRPEDGRLIAAAPDLLSATERLLSNFRGLLARTPVRDVAETIAEAESAIAKATGAAP